MDETDTGHDESRPYTKLSTDGYAIIANVLEPQEIDRFIAALNEVDISTGAVHRRGGVYAMRHLLALPAARQLAENPRVHALAESVLGQGAFPVRGILFDKTPGANWKVPWHQDMTIAVAERRDAPGFGPWSEKAGIVHVQPPIEILERMLAIRLHLDECDEGNAPLRVLPDSHRGGRLNDQAIAKWKDAAEAVPCMVPRGGALLMRPLLLHASSAAARPGHRRVVHIEWAAESLPHGLRWHEAG